MKTAEEQFQRVKRVKDNTRFDVDSLHHYNLYMQIGNSDIQLCVVAPRENSCLLIEDFKYDPCYGNDHLYVIDRIFDGHHLLKAGFWNHVRLSVKNRRFNLIPTSLFLKDHLEDYLSTNSPLYPGEEAYHYYKQGQVKAANVFAVDNYLLHFIKETYHNRQIQILHQGSSFIEGVLKSNDHSHEKSMYLLFDESILHIAVCRDHQLQFYNQFPIRHPKEFVRYTMMVIRKMGMDQERDKVLIWGDFQADSDIFKELYTFIRHVSFGSKPAYLGYNFMFDEVADHQYFDLLSLHLCD